MKKILSLLLASMFIFSCEPEVKFDENILVGDWEIVSAKRNNRPTRTLEGAWLKIDDKTMRDNFFSNEKKIEYSVSGDRITHHTKPDRKYKIIELTSDQMVLTTTFQKHEFEFRFAKKAE